MDKSTLMAPQIIQDMYMEYVDIPTPYFISHAEKTLRPRVYKGKGSPREIKKALEKMKGKSKKEIANKELLAEHNIGIDCSGFVSQLLDAYTMQTKGRHVWEYYKRRTINPVNWIMFKIQPIVSMLNSNTLSSKINTISIPKVKDAQPMDLIRFSGGKHVGMIYKITKKDGIVDEIEFIHSTEGTGVTKGIVKVTDENKSIVDQEWLPGENGALHEPSYLIRYRVNGNGIKRPIFLSE